MKISDYQATILATAFILGSYGIPYEYRVIHENGGQLLFDWANGADCVCHSFSYGNDDDKVESYGFPWDDGDVSVFSPYDFAKKVKELYEQKCG